MNDFVRFILETSPDWFAPPEAVTDFEGNELCPVCGCCSLVAAEVMSHSIFAQAEAILAGKPPEHRLVCEGGCEKTKRHA
jgi:hypothetical protein